jgi:hypothetical protein
VQAFAVDKLVDLAEGGQHAPETGRNDRERSEHPHDQDKRGSDGGIPHHG